MADQNKLQDPENQKKLNHFLIEHAPLINLHAKKLQNEGKVGSDIDTSDLHMAGFHGLMEAVHRYDPNVGASFSTYAGTRIRGKMLDHLSESSGIPKTLRDQARRLKEAENKPAPTKVEPPEES